MHVLVGLASSQMNGVCLSPTTGKQGQQAQQLQLQPQPQTLQPGQQQPQQQQQLPPPPQQPQQQVAASAKKLYTPDLKRTKSQGTRKLQKTQSTASAEESSLGTGGYFFIRHKCLSDRFSVRLSRVRCRFFLFLPNRQRSAHFQ